MQVNILRNRVSKVKRSISCHYWAEAQSLNQHAQQFSSVGDEKFSNFTSHCRQVNNWEKEREGARGVREKRERLAERVREKSERLNCEDRGWFRQSH